MRVALAVIPILPVLPVVALSASAIISVMLCIIESTVFEVFLLKDDEVNIVPWLGSTGLHLMLY